MRREAPSASSAIARGPVELVDIVWRQGPVKDHHFVDGAVEVQPLYPAADAKPLQESLLGGLYFFEPSTTTRAPGACGNPDLWFRMGRSSPGV